MAREAGALQALSNALERTLGLLARSYEQSKNDGFENMSVESASMTSSQHILLVCINLTYPVSLCTTFILTLLILGS